MSAPASPGALATRAAHGVKWTSASMVVVTLLQLAQVAVLARLLTTADFGLIAMIAVLLGIAQAYSDMGVSNALIWRQDATRNQLASLYWTNVFAGCGAYLVILVLTPLFAELLKQPKLETYLPVAALVVLILAWGQQFQVLLQRDLRFRMLASIEMAAAAAGTASAILAALAGLGVYALICGQLVNAGVRTAGLVGVGWKRWRPILHVRLNDLRGYLRFGAFQMGDRSLNELTANIDYLLIGRFLGSAALGVYSVAYQLVVLPFQKINPVLTRVAFPVFALRQDDHEAVGTGYCQLSELLVFLVFPLLVALLVLAPLVVPVLFGPKWMGAVPLVQVLSLMAMVKTLANPWGALLLSRGRAGLGFLINGVQVCVTLLAFLVAVRFGTLAVAWAWVVVSLASFFVWQPLVLRVIHLAFGEYVRSLARPLLMTAILALLLEAAYLPMRRVVGSDSLLLALMLATGAVIHLSLWLLMDRRFVAYTYSMLKAARVQPRDQLG